MRCGEGSVARAMLTRARAVLLGAVILAPLMISAQASATRRQSPASAKDRSGSLAPLMLGIGGDPLLATGGLGARAIWIRRALNDGAAIVRVNVQWSQVAPVRPVHPANPHSVGYNWTLVDTAVRALSARGLAVMLMLYDAPRWAEGRHRPSAVQAGSWRPNPRAFAQFAAAAARRYDGHVRDPLRPRAHLPRVRYWQAWNEPNVDQYFSPQRVKTRHGWRTVSPDAYRRLLDAFYAAVKHVSRSNYVVSGGTSSFGNGPEKPLGKEATAPVDFYRMLFCLHGSGSLRAARGCPRVELDAVDHHPYDAAGPYHHGKHSNWVTIPDVHKIVSLIRAGVRSGTVLPRGPKPMWVTELGWSSNPPNSRGVPVDIDARWYEQAFYTLWRQGVGVIMSLLIGDPPRVLGNNIVLDGGLYYHDGAPKPIVTAYRFPFVVTSLGAGRFQAWGRSPRTGPLTIEALRGGAWHVVRTVQVQRWQVFETSLTGHGATSWRARIGSATSLSWKPGAYTHR